jgi:hypothetical protein
LAGRTREIVVRLGAWLAADARIAAQRSRGIQVSMMREVNKRALESLQLEDMKLTIRR